MERRKLNSLIEKEAFKLVMNVKNHSDSFLQLYSRRNNVKIEPEILNKLIEVVGLAMDDGFGSQVNFFNENVSKALDEYLGDEVGEAKKGKK